jgi:integrase/recombinase XerD
MSTESLWNQNLLARYAHLPMAEERQQFLQHKLDEGSSWSSLRQLGIYIAAAVSRMQLTSESRLTPKAIDIAAKAWANREPHASRLNDPQQVQRRFRVIVTDWFRFLGRLDEPPILEGPHHSVLQNFAGFLRDERGLAEPTIKKQCETAKEFLRSHPLTTIQTHRNATKSYLNHVTQLRKRGFTRSGVSAHIYALRSFVRYAEQQKLIQPGLSDFMIPPRMYQDERLCLGPSWSEVQRLLKDTDTKKPVDIRDRAILMLLATYGLRASEVAHLSINDVDWEHQQLSVYRSKTRRKALFPLNSVVGASIRKYLDHLRPNCRHDALFVRVKAPHTRITPSSVSSMVATRLRDSGIKVERNGAHTLRHACAARLLAEGLSLKAIGDQLGHGSPDATRIYAKVDLIALRHVANFDFGGLL